MRGSPGATDAAGVRPPADRTALGVSPPAAPISFSFSRLLYTNRQHKQTTRECYPHSKPAPVQGLCNFLTPVACSL